MDCYGVLITNGVIIQWMHFTDLTPNGWTYTLPITFKSWGVIVAMEANITSNAAHSIISGCMINTNQFNITSNKNSTPIYVISIGY